jgi:hypothetical protein
MRLFDKKDPPASGKAGQEVLWALVYEIPAQMAEADEIFRTGWRLGAAFPGERES